MNLDTLAAATRDVASPTAEQLAAGRHRLDVAIHAADARVAAARRNRRPLRWAATVLAGAAAAGAAVLVAPLLSAPPASAEEVMLAAADAAGRQTDETAGATYWRTTAEVDYPGSEPFRRETWQGRPGRASAGDDEPAGDTADGPAEHLPEIGTYVIGAETLTWADLERLPTDAASLEQVLRAMVRDDPPGGDDELWEGLTTLLRESPASPALRSALWRVAAGMPGVELLGPTTDAVGRSGTAIERTASGEGWYRVVYVLDPVDGTVLETRTLRADGTLVYRTTDLSRSAGTSPPSGRVPRCEPDPSSGLPC